MFLLRAWPSKSETHQRLYLHSNLLIPFAIVAQVQDIYSYLTNLSQIQLHIFTSFQHYFHISQDILVFPNQLS